MDSHARARAPAGRARFAPSHTPRGFQCLLSAHAAARPLHVETTAVASPPVSRGATVLMRRAPWLCAALLLLCTAAPVEAATSSPPPPPPPFPVASPPPPPSMQPPGTAQCALPINNPTAVTISGPWYPLSYCSGEFGCGVSCTYGCIVCSVRNPRTTPCPRAPSPLPLRTPPSLFCCRCTLCTTCLASP